MEAINRFKDEGLEKQSFVGTWVCSRDKVTRTCRLEKDRSKCKKRHNLGDQNPMKALTSPVCQGDQSE